VKWYLQETEVLLGENKNKYWTPEKPIDGVERNAGVKGNI
jgi:hypothetical protein